MARLVPKISFSPEPNSDISLSLGITPATHTPEEILNLPEHIARQKEKRIVVCIDEFQQIGEFADSLTVQKRLRTVWHITAGLLLQNDNKDNIGQQSQKASIE